MGTHQGNMFKVVQSSVFNDLNGECRKFSFTWSSPNAIEERCKSSLFLYKSVSFQVTVTPQ
uniref:Uncharacterized protein n=1 Tax=Anguilla anguilla TaxID=7936 RepID=A0A0E9PFS2_ANGAN